MNKDFIYVIQIILSVALVGLILMQNKGTGLGSTFGGEMGFYRTRRGVERMVFYLTIGVSALFLLTSVIRLLL